MVHLKNYEVIIIGGSYSGLSAAMTLGRALRNVLIIDSGKPCNAQTPHSQNFLTQDGQTPQEISSKAKEQVAKYKTVHFYDGFALGGKKTGHGFEISTLSGKIFLAKKLIFATGVKDIMPNLKGFSESWGISVIHCPYCHGYEVRNEKTGILGNGDYGFDFSRLIYNWTKDLTLFTNGKSMLSSEETELLGKHNIPIVETEIDSLEQKNGYIENVVFKDGSKSSLKALYARPAFVQRSDIPSSLGCALTEQGHIQVDAFQKTTLPGVYACGDNTTPMRTVSNAVAMGTMAGAALNRELIGEEF